MTKKIEFIVVALSSFVIMGKILVVKVLFFENSKVSKNYLIKMGIYKKKFIIIIKYNLIASNSASKSIDVCISVPTTTSQGEQMWWHDNKIKADSALCPVDLNTYLIDHIKYVKQMADLEIIIWFNCSLISIF